MVLIASALRRTCTRLVLTVGILSATFLAGAHSAEAESTRLRPTDRFFPSKNPNRLVCLFRDDTVLPARQHGRRLVLLSRTSGRMAFCRGNIHRIRPKLASDRSLCSDLNLRRTERDEHVDPNRERCVFDRRGKEVTAAFSPFVQVFAYARNDGTTYGYSFPIACGGTVIARNKILVSASCLLGNNGFTVRYQSWNGAFRSVYSEDFAVFSDTVQEAVVPVFGVITLPDDVPAPQASVPSRRVSLKRGGQSIAVSFDFVTSERALDRPTACRVKIDSTSPDGQFVLNGPAPGECLVGEEELDFGAVLVAARPSLEEKNLIQGIFSGSISTWSDGVPRTTNRFYRLDTPAARAFLASHVADPIPRAFHVSPVGDARVCYDLQASTPEMGSPLDLLEFRRFNAATCALNATSPYAHLLVKDHGDIVGTCSGTFLDSRTILTAAHCLYKSDGTMKTSVEARFGVDLQQSIESSTLIPHPTYDHLSGVRAHDIALVKLSVPAAVSTLPIASISPLENDLIYYHGFGSHGAPMASFFNNRKKILGGKMRIAHVSDHFLNVARDGFQTVTFRGDSGSPILIVEGGVLKVAGVVSGGSGLSGQAGDVARYVNIQETSKITFITDNLG
jgi:hypothetical protein